MPDSRFPAEGHQARPWVRPGTSIYCITSQHSGWPQSTVKVTQKLGSRQSSRKSLGHSTSAGRSSIFRNSFWNIDSQIFVGFMVHQRRTFHGTIIVPAVSPTAPIIPATRPPPPPGLGVRSRGTVSNTKLPLLQLAVPSSMAYHGDGLHPHWRCPGLPVRRLEWY